jgi:Raf kinase inhibitor-like YbhB/YbcL family protein
MKKILSILALACVAGTAQAADFTVSSSDFPTEVDTQIKSLHVFSGFGCTGDNISPAVSWSGAPEETKSYALTIYDPDAPTGSGWWHWVVFNIPASVTSLDTGASITGLPEGASQTRNDYGTVQYGGPCPPEGDEAHRYIITVHALDVEKLDLAPDTPAAQVGYNLHVHGLAKAELVAKYGR